jgi:flavin-dependent dehydrogenase
MKRPVTIAGGGVAGLALGVRLRERGVAVILHEAGRYPRHRVCGEFFAGQGEVYLRRLGVVSDADGLPRHTLSHWQRGSGRPVSIRLPQSALGLSRHRLDAELADRFQALGGELLLGSRLSEAAGAETGVVWATGRSPGRESEWVGLKGHTLRADRPEGLEVHFGEGAYVGVSGVEGGRMNVCGLFLRRDWGRVRKEAVLLRALESVGLGGLAERVQALGLDETSLSAVSALRLGWRGLPADRIHVGDALAVIPPFTGDGMSLALESAFLVEEPVAAFAGGRMEWADCVRRCHHLLEKCLAGRCRRAAWLHPFLLNGFGQRLLLLAARAGCLPFGSLHRFTHGTVPAH